LEFARQGDADHQGVTREQAQELIRLGLGYRVSQCMYVVAKFGIPDLLKDGPKTITELASTTNVDASSLFRVVRLLTGIGLFKEVAPQSFALTPLGRGLRSDIPGSTSAQLLLVLDEFQWRPWGHLLHSVQTGETAFRHVHGMDLFDYLRDNAEAAAVFDRAMTGITATSGDAVARLYDWSPFKRVVDVGGGQGFLLATVLRAVPTLRGLLLDRPDVVAGAMKVLQRAGVADRCDVVGGDFFSDVPKGGDAYVLRQVIHDWADDDARRILERCREAVSSAGKLLIIERLVTSDYSESLPALQADVEMLVNVGGLQRTEEEYAALLAATGFRPTRTVQLHDAPQFSVLEADPV
jgi:hypothetical protein